MRLSGWRGRRAAHTFASAAVSWPEACRRIWQSRSRQSPFASRRTLGSSPIGVARQPPCGAAGHDLMQLCGGGSHRGDHRLRDPWRTGCLWRVDRDRAKPNPAFDAAAASGYEPQAHSSGAAASAAEGDTDRTLTSALDGDARGSETSNTRSRQSVGRGWPCYLRRTDV